MQYDYLEHSSWILDFPLHYHPKSEQPRLRNPDSDGTKGKQTNCVIPPTSVKLVLKTFFLHIINLLRLAKLPGITKKNIITGFSDQLVFLYVQNFSIYTSAFILALRDSVPVGKL